MAFQIYGAAKLNTRVRDDLLMCGLKVLLVDGYLVNVKDIDYENNIVVL